MTYTCIICGNEINNIVCKGRVKSLSVSFCQEHSDMCENCVSMICTNVNPRTIEKIL